MTALVLTAAKIEHLVRIVHRIGIPPATSARTTGQLWERIAEGVTR
jgi:hypothetical protein